jgi:hypothetical protein
MKKVLLLVITLPLWINAFNQEPQLYENIVMEEQHPKLYLGTSTGINNINGYLGITVEGNIVDKLTILGSAGLGMWGLKMGVGPRYYPNYPVGIFYTINFTTSSGFQGIELPMETNRSLTDTISLNLNRANNLNFSLGYQFKIFNRGRFHFEIGYSARLEKSPYEVVTPGVELTELSQRVMDMMVPGGIILGLGISMGL